MFIFSKIYYKFFKYGFFSFISALKNSGSWKTCQINVYKILPVQFIKIHFNHGNLDIHIEIGHSLVHQIEAIVSKMIDYRNLKSSLKLNLSTQHVCKFFFINSLNICSNFKNWFLYFCDLIQSRKIMAGKLCFRSRIFGGMFRKCPVDLAQRLSTPALLLPLHSSSRSNRWIFWSNGYVFHLVWLRVCLLINKHGDFLEWSI